MTNKDFNKFYDYVESVNDSKDPIFWCGYYWINLTERQCNKIANMLKDKPYIKLTYNFRNQYGVELPSGLHIAFPE